MTGVISWFTRHRTAANLLLVLLIALGLTVFGVQDTPPE